MTDTMVKNEARDLREAAICDLKNRKQQVQSRRLHTLSVRVSAFAVILSVVFVVYLGLKISTKTEKIVEETPQTGIETTAPTAEPTDGNIVIIFEDATSSIAEYETTTEEFVSNEAIEEETTENTSNSYNLTETEINLLVQAVMHETGANPDFYPFGDFDIVQQYMAASILNRIGQPGFGMGFSTAYTLYDVLANTNQYDTLLWELDSFDPYTERCRNNVLSVLNGYAYTPDFLYFERCSMVGEDYWSAQESFYAQYGYNSSIQIAYMTLTKEGRYLIFATNPYGAYASAS